MTPDKSDPVAWLAFATDGSESNAVYATDGEAQAAADAWGWTVMPLYLAPRLTDAERSLLDMLADHPVTHEIMPHEVATLRGLLERFSDRPKPVATPAPSSTPAECTLPPEWTSRPYWVDPPSGHRYGFPRLYDPAKDGDLTEWMIANGYPEKLARQGLACTFTAYTDDGEK